MPGHVAARVYPRILPHLAARLSAGTVLISGTNGKTTTARMLAAIASSAGLLPVHNRAGANLPAGVLSALISASDLRGRLRSSLGLFEVDEAHVPAAVDATHPRVVLLTNLFRDQLDRYGEIDLIARRWQDTVNASGAEISLTVNVDDPLLAHLAIQTRGRTMSFGIETQDLGSALLSHEADRRLCPACGGRLHYSWSYYGHLGHYTCTACTWQRPRPDLAVISVETDPDGATRAALTYEGRQVRARIGLPGLHNVYNATAAVAAALALGIELETAINAVADVRGAFGRNQRIVLGTGSLTLVLVKNPVGFNQALRGMSPDCNRATIAINDLFADGTDVSWLWDVDFGPVVEREMPITCTGRRAHDMAVRLKYDGDPLPTVQPDLNAALNQAVGDAEHGGHVTFFSTYTATMEVQHQLSARGLIPAFWES
jgi:lipid II isoglutaminyl synthase (glutamine-hydrolysing)